MTSKLKKAVACLLFMLAIFNPVLWTGFTGDMNNVAATNLGTNLNPSCILDLDMNSFGTQIVGGIKDRLDPNVRLVGQSFSTESGPGGNVVKGGASYANLRLSYLYKNAALKQSIDTTGGQSYELWISCKGLVQAVATPGVGTNYPVLLTMVGSTGSGADINNSRKLLFDLGRPKVITTGSDGTTSRSYLPTDPNYKFPIDGWHHWVVTVIGSACTMYIDGVNVPVTATGSVITSFGNDSSKPIYIGNNPETTDAFRGSYGAARIYKKVLSQQEVLSDYNKEQPYYNSKLSGLSVAGGVLSTVFDPSIYTYNCTIPYSVAIPKITATKTGVDSNSVDPNAVILTNPYAIPDFGCSTIGTSFPGLTAIDRVYKINYIIDSANQNSEYYFGNIYFTNKTAADNTDTPADAITRLTAGSPIKAVVDVRNRSLISKPATLVLAVYRNDILENFVYSSTTLPANVGSGTLRTGGITLPADLTGYTVRAYLWDTVESMTTMTRKAITP